VVYLMRGQYSPRTMSSSFGLRRERAEWSAEKKRGMFELSMNPGFDGEEVVDEEGVGRETWLVVVIVDVNEDEDGTIA
jgi:hypothetical protein